MYLESIIKDTTITRILGCLECTACPFKKEAIKQFFHIVLSTFNKYLLKFHNSALKFYKCKEKKNAIVVLPAASLRLNNVICSFYQRKNPYWLTKNRMTWTTRLWGTMNVLKEWAASQRGRGKTSCLWCFGGRVVSHKWLSATLLQFRGVMIHSLVGTCAPSTFESQKYRTACGTFKRIISWLSLSFTEQPPVIRDHHFVKADDTKLNLA